MAVHPRILILSNPDEHGQFAYRLSVTLPSGRTTQKMEQFNGPWPDGTPAEQRQAVKQTLQQAWQAYKDSLRDVAIQGKKMDDQGQWDF